MFDSPVHPCGYNFGMHVLFNFGTILANLGLSFGIDL